MPACRSGKTHILKLRSLANAFKSSVKKTSPLLSNTFPVILYFLPVASRKSGFHLSYYGTNGAEYFT
jgi:hypothetical protein